MASKLRPNARFRNEKSRPCVILNNNMVGKLALKIIAPLTDFKEHYELVPWMVTIEPNTQNGLSKKSSIDLFQVRSLLQKRLTHKVGYVEDDVLEACKVALSVVFD